MFHKQERWRGKWNHTGWHLEVGKRHEEHRSYSTSLWSAPDQTWLTYNEISKYLASFWITKILCSERRFQSLREWPATQILCWSYSSVAENLSSITKLCVQSPITMKMRTKLKLTSWDQTLKKRHRLSFPTPTGTVRTASQPYLKKLFFLLSTPSLVNSMNSVGFIFPINIFHSFCYINKKDKATIKPEGRWR